MKKVFQDLGIHESWWDEFIPIFQDKRMNKILKVLDKTKFTPSKKNMFKVFSMPISNIRVVILGESPYSKEGISTGLAFASNSTLPNSLGIMLNTIEREYYVDDFTPSRLDQKYDLMHWHNKGVFLLNTSLSTQVDVSNSHSVYWKWFTKKIIDLIQHHHSGIVWMLWGSLAQSYNVDENLHYVLKENLPKEWSTNPFKFCNNILTSNNGEIIF